MAAKKPPPRLFVPNGNHENTVLNWHDEPAKELHLYGEAFWNAAKELLKNEGLDRYPIASFDAAVVVYLYRHALELFLKEILLGRGGDLLSNRPSPKAILDAGHTLTRFLPDIRRIFAECGWDKEFGTGSVKTFDDFIAILDEFEKADPSSFCFRYPINKDLTKTLHSHFTFSVRQFAETMDEILGTLSGACFGLPEEADARAEAAHEMSQAEMEYADPQEPDYD
jgi:hypothetical protein